MKTSRHGITCVLAAVLLLGAAASARSQLVPVGGEIRANTLTSGDQGDPAVATDAQGNFVVIWTNAASFSNTKVAGQRFDASGHPLGSEFQVNTFSNGGQSRPGVGMDAAGNFVVVWMSHGQIPPAFFSVLGRRYDSAGNPLGGEFEISTGQSTIFPTVAMAANGSFMALWEGRAAGTFDADNLYVRLYDANGTPQTAPLQVTTTPAFSFRSAVTAAPLGDWIVAWGSGGNVLVRRYDAAGAPLGPESQIGSGASEVGVAAGGNRIVTGWSTSINQGIGGPQALLFDSSFTPVTGLLQPTTAPALPTQEVSLAMDGSGKFTIAWVEEDLLDDNDHFLLPCRDGSEAAILARTYDAAGNPLGSDFVVNTTAKGFQTRPALAMSPAGRLVAAWSGPRADLSDDIFVQVYAPPTPQDQIAALITQINTLVTAGSLAPNRANPLINKLDQVINKLNGGQTNAACGQLGAFLNQLNADIGNGTLTAAQGQALLTAANAIQANIGC
jgi:hypothetical protein